MQCVGDTRVFAGGGGHGIRLNGGLINHVRMPGEDHGGDGDLGLARTGQALALSPTTAPPMQKDTSHD